MGIFREHGGAYGSGIEYAYSMVHKTPQSAHNPHVVKRVRLTQRRQVQFLQAGLPQERHE